LKQQLQSKGAPRSEIDIASEVLNPEALTIGFARRFATYKRATLILKNKERLIKLLTNKERPVQIIIAGKAHPRDDPGKEFIREIVHFSKDERVRRNIVFIEDYDLVIARYLVQGADVWLNTPRRPLEASGTSGMKAAINGVLNFSVLDGWWDEAYDPNVGWAIGEGEEYTDHAYQDQVESNALMDHLEKEIVPLFYNRGSDGLPREWIDMMKASISKLGSYFNTNRMVRDYTEQFYVPAGKHYNDLKKDNHLRARNIAVWKKKVQDEWPKLRIERIETQGLGQIVVGDEIGVTVKLELGNLSEEDVIVQAYVGRVGSGEEITDGTPILLMPVKEEKGVFKGKILCKHSGKIGYVVRVMPHHPDLNPIHSRLILWS
jgi:starch phosphorylase